MIKITLLITNYNYGTWLRRCIRSCLNQSFIDYEIIIIDDASTDNSKDILSDYSDNEKIKIIYNKYNMGVGAASNIGLRMAKGKYFVRVDSDDYVHEDFLKCLYLYSSFNNSHATACSYQVVDMDENIKEQLSQEESSVACGILFRTDLLEMIGSYDGTKRINEEKDLLNRFKENNLTIDYLNIPLYRYYKHENSISNPKK